MGNLINPNPCEQYYYHLIKHVEMSCGLIFEFYAFLELSVEIKNRQRDINIPFMSAGFSISEIT